MAADSTVIVHKIRAALDGDSIMAWSNTIASPSIGKGMAFESNILKDGVDSTMVEGAKEIPYEIPNFRCDAHSQWALASRACRQLAGPSQTRWRSLRESAFVAFPYSRQKGDASAAPTDYGSNDWGRDVGQTAAFYLGSELTRIARQNE